ncbi:hypothetical protein DEMA109039_09015 [Deinococcus marmoris]
MVRMRPDVYDTAPPRLRIALTRSPVQQGQTGPGNNLLMVECEESKVEAALYGVRQLLGIDRTLGNVSL